MAAICIVGHGVMRRIYHVIFEATLYNMWFMTNGRGMGTCVWLYRVWDPIRPPRERRPIDMWEEMRRVYDI